MRNSWIEDPKYIVNLVKSIIGENTLKHLSTHRHEINPQSIHSYVVAMVRTKVEKMGFETLGRICSYASASGVHIGGHFPGTARPKFINRTGLDDVMTVQGCENFLLHLGVGEYLIQGAMGVISCIVVDIIYQKRWHEIWDTLETTTSEE
jgi:hypothetical protein